MTLPAILYSNCVTRNKQTSGSSTAPPSEWQATPITVSRTPTDYCISLDGKMPTVRRRRPKRHPQIQRQRPHQQHTMPEPIRRQDGTLRRHDKSHEPDDHRQHRHIGDRRPSVIFRSPTSRAYPHLTHAKENRCWAQTLCGPIC